MVLNDIEIRERIAFSKLVEIPGRPYTQYQQCYESAIQPASYDFSLSSDFKRVKSLEWRKIDNLYADIEEPVEYADQPSAFLQHFARGFHARIYRGSSEYAC